MALVEVKVPDIGDFKDVAVIEVLVKPGDTLKLEQSLITVESDKAAMEIPSSVAGVIKELKIKVGDKVNIGDLLALVESAASADAASPAASAPVPASAPAPAAAPDLAPVAGAAAQAAVATAAPALAAVVATPVAAPVADAAAAAATTAALSTGHVPHASPSVRKFARELGVPLAELKGSGPKGRITQGDVQQFTQAVMAGSTQTQASAVASKGALAGATATEGAALGLLPWPKVDFVKFGAIERVERSRIKKISAANLHRNWVMIPHVTNHDDADITDLEALRVQLNKEHEKAGVKFTLLAFLIKACVAALQKFPEFNASLDGEQLVLKKYVHIGFAADTPNGLMVPVLKDADKKGLVQIAKEMSELAGKARDGKLSAAEMTGGCFSISSLGGIGGTYFSPIINAPEVAILGVCKGAMKPVWDAGANGGQFVPRLILPLSLSYDHRVIDGASAARFNTYLTQVLADFRRVLL